MRPLFQFALLFLSTFSVLAQDSSIANWDVTIPRGETREITFETDEGTWMSVDIASDGKWLVFDLLGHVYRVPVMGGEAVNLTAGSGIALNYHPRISPDGSEIAFISDRLGQDNLWVMQADGSDSRPVEVDENSRAVEPAWMPDGERILVTKRLMTGYGFYRMDDAIWIYQKDGSGSRALVERGAGASPLARFSGNPRYQWPSVDADGDYIYFNTADFDGDDRYIQRLVLESGEIQSVTGTSKLFPSCCGRPAYTDRLGEYAPEISPDGRYLAFARKLPGSEMKFRDKHYSGRTALWLRDMQSGAERILLDPITADASEGHPSWKTRVLPGYSWSADSASIVISVDGGLRRLHVENGRVETIPFTAQVRRRISEQARGRVEIGETFPVRAPRWAVTAPDGSRLAFEAAGRLWLKELPDEEPRAVTAEKDGKVERTPAFSADGKHLVYVEEARDGTDHLSIVRLADGASQTIETPPGDLLYPHFSPDGLAVLVSHDPAMLARPDLTGQWQLLRVPLPGGYRTHTEAVVKLGSHPRTEMDAGGRLYFASVNTFSQTAIHSVRTDGRDRRTHLLLDGPALQFSVSPDGKRLAFVRARDVHEVKLPSGMEDEPPVVDPMAADNSLSIQRLSESGGSYPHWLSETVVGFVNGSEHRRHDLETGRDTHHPLGLTLDRNIARGSIALRNARLITMSGGPDEVISRGSILVEDGRIRCVGNCDISRADEVIDARGKTVTPGWVDTHAHHQSGDLYGMIPAQRADSAIYLSYGVTTTFDPAGPDQSFVIGEMTAAGTILGPRSFSSGPILTCDWDKRIFMRGGLTGDADDLRRINTYQHALNHVRRHVARGAISIKDYKQCTRSQRQMLTVAAREAGVSITTENGDLNFILGQIMNGHTGWEHPLQYVPIYSDVARFVGQSRSHYSASIILSNYPHGNAIEYWFGSSDLWHDDKARTWMDWRQLAARRIFVDKPLAEFMFPILAEGAWDMARAGGYPTIAAHGEQHGLGNHWEVWSMAMAAPPLEALRYATWNGARFLGLDQDLGSIEVGKIADLVVLDSNPLDNIRNTTDIRYVMKNGRLYDAVGLNELWPEKTVYGPRPWERPEIFRE